MPARVARYEAEGRRVVVLPSTFEVSEPRVAAFLESTGATLFARERRSATDTGLPLAHCPSFFFDYREYQLSGRAGRDTLYAYRTDSESSGLDVPRHNVDISLRYTNLDRWLRVISSYRTVHTDRAHVMVAAALMGKRVIVRPCSYFKVFNLAATWLSDYDVLMEATPPDTFGPED